MNLVDKQDASVAGIGQIWKQIFRSTQRWAGSDLQFGTQFARNHGGQGRFSKSRRSVEKQVS